MYTDEFHNRFSGRYFGKFRALVSSIDDPTKRCRIKVKMPVTLGWADDSGWAWPSPNVGGAVGVGDTALPEPGDLVWLEFEEGDPSRPIWSFGPWGIRNKEIMTPNHAVGEADTTDYARRDYGNIPPSQFGGEYGYVRTISNKGGSYLEFDDTPGASRICMSHPTGSRIELQPDGGYQLVVGQSSIFHVGGNQNTQIGGRYDCEVFGESTLSIGGEYTETYSGDRIIDTQSVSLSGINNTEEWTGDYELSIAGNSNQKIFAQMSTQVGGQWSINTGQNLLVFAGEFVEIVGSNSSGQLSAPPMLNSVTIHGYNGKSIFKATDITGNVLESSITCDGITGMMDINSTTMITLTAGPAGGSIQLLPSPAGGVLLGGTGAVSPVVKGNELSIVLNTLMIGLIAFCSTGSGATIEPTFKAACVALNTVLSSTLPPQMANILSTSVLTK